MNSLVYVLIAFMTRSTMYKNSIELTGTVANGKEMVVMTDALGYLI